MSVWADTKVMAQLSQVAVGTPAYNLTLHGSDNGLLPFEFPVQSAFEAVEGAYSGLAKQVNVKRKSGLLSGMSMLDNDSTKVFVGKNEWYLYLEVKTYADDGTTLLSTETAAVQLTEARRVAAANVANRIVVSGHITAYAIT